MTQASTEFTILIPLYNEAESLPELQEKLNRASWRDQFRFDVIYIDDGSTDHSWEILTRLTETNPNTSALRLRKNFGKATALSAGIAQATKEIIVTMDADLQDDPEEIGRLLEKLNQGYDLVCGWRRSRQDPLIKLLPSLIFNVITSRVTGINLKDSNCGLKIYRKCILDSLNLYGELHRYIPVMANDLGYRLAEIPVNHFPRRFGKSKYGYSRFPHGLLDLLTVLTITKYARQPGHLFGGIGLTLNIISMAILLYMASIWFFTPDSIGHRPLLLLGILLLIVSFQFLFFGLLLEFIVYKSPARFSADLITQRIVAPETSRLKV